MDHMFRISDDESESPDDVGDTNKLEVTRATRPGESLTGPDLTGEAFDRLRLRSESHVSTSSQGEDDEFPDASTSEEGGEPFRARSRSAPSRLWAAKRYGQQLRRMSDEFDTLLDERVRKEMKRVHSAGTTGQIQPSRSWFSFLSSHKETDSRATE
ncbi:hypothetical protein JZ751_006772 [Albula glossodonta]|uniref:Bcl2-associated agonist of cell death n=1 Tax=Albula glossodonta TaxID=121402 RepID=A0A8T2P5A6_9TELE|nr:hypothetical protein JZ751_006772 [Albula glossodonta]